MLAKPVGDDRRLPAAKHLDRLASLQINDDGAVPMTALDGPVIDADDNRWRGRRGTSGTPQLPQHSVAAHGHAQPRSKASRRFSAEGVAERAHSLAQSLRAALARCGQTVERLGEGTPGAIRVDALESANVDRERDALPEARQITELALVASMHLGAAAQATRTRRTANRARSPPPVGDRRFRPTPFPPIDVLANCLQRSRQAWNDGHRNLDC